MCTYTGAAPKRIRDRLRGGRPRYRAALKLFLYKDVDTFKHSKRVFRYAMDISEVLGLDSVERRNFVLGALIHDIGKLEIPWGS